MTETYGIDAAAYGARGDGLADDSPALQRALDAGRSRVHVPAGTYRIGNSLRIGSDTSLILHPQARIILAAGAGIGTDVHLITNKNPAGGDQNIRVEGGIWDGNNPANPRGPDAPGSYTGVAVNFINVRGLALRRMHVLDPESFFIRLGEVRDFRVEEISLEAPHLRPNQDGIHLGGFCSNGVIRDVRAVGRGATNDDLVAVNADDAVDRAINLGMKRGPIERIHIQNLSARECHSFLRFASVWSPIRDVRVENVEGGCSVNAVNADALRYCRTPIFDSTNPAYAKGVGLLERITLSGFRVHRTGGNHPLFLLETRMRDFAIENFSRDRKRDAMPFAPSFRIAGVPGCNILFEGIGEKDLSRVRESLSPIPMKEIMRLAGTEAFRVETALEEGETLLCRAGECGAFHASGPVDGNLPPFSP